MASQLSAAESEAVEAVRAWLDSWFETLCVIYEPLGNTGQRPEIPDWVRNCGLRLRSTLFFPVTSVLSSVVFTPYHAGYSIGIMRWGLKGFEAMPPAGLSQTAKKLRLSAGAKRKIGKLLEVFFLRTGCITRAELSQSRFIPSNARKYHNQADRLPPSQATEYYRGLADGLRGIGPGSSEDKSTAATPTLLILGMWWRRVQQFRSVTELHQWLIRVLGKRRAGEKKHVEKICERIGLRLAKRGRPKSKPTLMPPG